MRTAAALSLEGQQHWATGPTVLRRIALALRITEPEFGVTCRRAGPDDSPVDLILPPRTPVGHRLSCPTASLPVAGRFPAVSSSGVRHSHGAALIRSKGTHRMPNVLERLTRRQPHLGVRARIARGDLRTSITHLLTPAAAAAGRVRAGRYLALRGAQVTPAAIPDGPRSRRASPENSPPPLSGCSLEVSHDRGLATSPGGTAPISPPPSRPQPPETSDSPAHSQRRRHRHRQWRTDTGMDLVTDTPGVPEQHQPGQPRPGRALDRTITATCQVHGAKGFCNLRVTKAGDGIVLNPHVAGSCVITLDEAGVAALRDLLIEWHGGKGR